MWFMGKIRINHFPDVAFIYIRPIIGYFNPSILLLTGIGDHYMSIAALNCFQRFTIIFNIAAFISGTSTPHNNYNPCKIYSSVFFATAYDSLT
ncbi:MAG: hypothetical protein BGO54_02665 [Sphingobacteriales bacterium 46-32]|nr:MAG: hypothetical protein BGO54_02665 [Sphingobacteriales bacterium 46-32]